MTKMKKIMIIALLIFLQCQIVFSQIYENEKRSIFQLSFFPPISTNGFRSYQYTNKVSLNVLAGISKNEETFVWAGLSNIVLENANGFQFAGLFNYIGNEGAGMSFSGLANITKENYSGFQMAGIINIAKEVNGLQFSAIVNKAKNVSGSQISFMLNIAENNDTPIGLLNIIKNGEYGISISHNEINTTSVTFRSGGKNTYGIIGLGYNPNTQKKPYITTLLGLGAHINCVSWLRINNEINGENMDNFSDKLTFRVGYALLPAFRISHIELFGGPSINYLYSNDNNNAKLFPNKSLWKDFNSSTIKQIYIGYQFGIQYIF